MQKTYSEAAQRKNIYTKSMYVYIHTNMTTP